MRGAQGHVISGKVGVGFFRETEVGQSRPAQRCTNETQLVGGRTRGIIGSQEIAIEAGERVFTTNCEGTVQDVFVSASRDFSVTESPAGLVGVVCGATPTPGHLHVYHKEETVTLAAEDFSRVRAVDVGEDVLIFGMDASIGLHLFRGTPSQLLNCRF